MYSYFFPLSAPSLSELTGQKGPPQSTTDLRKDFQSCNSMPSVDPPQMYDFATERPQWSSDLKTLDFEAIAHLSDPNTPEISFDLDTFSRDQTQAPKLAKTLQAEFLAAKASKKPNVPVNVSYGFPTPQTAGFGSVACIKQEPDSAVESTYDPGYSSMFQLPDTLSSTGNNTNSSYKDEVKKKKLDKASDEYKRRRERNNVAVRKSREKAKLRCKDTERQVSDLESQNEKLRFEISVLKDLLANVKRSAKP